MGAMKQQHSASTDMHLNVAIHAFLHRSLSIDVLNHKPNVFATFRNRFYGAALPVAIANIGLTFHTLH